MGQRPAIFIENDFSEKNTGGVAHSLQLDAYVELFENGEYLTPLLPQEDNCFTDTNIHFKEGNYQTYKASKPEYPTATENFYIPHQPKILSTKTSVTASPIINFNQKSNYFRFKIAFENDLEVSQYFSVRANYEGIYVEIDSLNTESYTDTLTYFGSTDLSTDSHLLEVIKIDGTETYGIPTKDKKNTAAF